MVVLLRLDQVGSATRLSEDRYGQELYFLPWAVTLNLKKLQYAT